MSDNRPGRYVEVDAEGRETVVYRASSLGGCVRTMVAYARGFTPRPHPQWFQDVLDEGTEAEPEIDRQWSEHIGMVSETYQPEYELFVGNIDGRRVIVRCHPDAISERDPVTGHTRYVREYKKFRPSTWGTFVERGVYCNDYYPWQVSIEMLTTGLDCEFVGGRYVDGQIVEVQGKLYTEPPVPRIAIIKQVAKVERLINEGYAPAEVECKASYPCPFWPLHDDQYEERVKVTDVNAVHAYHRWKYHQAEIAKLKKALEIEETHKAGAHAQLVTALRTLGLDGAESKRFEIDGENVTRIRGEHPEQVVTRKAYTTDYFKRGKTT